MYAIFIKGDKIHVEKAYKSLGNYFIFTGSGLTGSYKVYFKDIIGLVEKEEDAVLNFPQYFI